MKERLQLITGLFKRITELLDLAGIPYMLSGSLAMNFYAVSRMTNDIDIVIDLFLKDLDKFILQFEHDFYLDRDSVRESIVNRGMFNVIDQMTGLKVDFIVRHKTPFHIQEFSRREKVLILGKDAWIVTPEDLVVSKLIWIQDIVSERQQNDIRNLMELTGIDMDYIGDWIKELNLKTYNLF
jgi:hypothetical protein